MCNEYERYVDWYAYCKLMQDLEWGTPTQQSKRELPQGGCPNPGHGARHPHRGQRRELAQMRWSFPPPRPDGKPVFNFRSEGRNFRDGRRCLIPARAFSEFTGQRTAKSKHRFTLVGQPFFCIAGIWRDGAAGEPPDFTMLTTAPGPDVAPYHDR